MALSDETRRSSPAVRGAWEYDVVVCGGGPAGVGAAVAAGRAGARTLLVEATGCLGGLIGNAGVSSFCDSPGGPVFDDLAQRLTALGAAFWTMDEVRHRAPGRLRLTAPDTARAVCMEMVREAGVETLMLSLAVGVVKDGGRVAGVKMATKQGLVEARAKAVVDCTADGDVAAAAGAEFWQGDPEDGRIQACSFRWSMGGAIDGARFDAAGLSAQDLERLFGQAVRDGAIQPPEALFHQERDCFPYDRASGRLRMTGWELKGVDPADPEQTSRALAQCHVAALQIVRFCRKHLPGHENCQVGRLPATLGTRESRRIVGGYQVTGKDVIRGAKFEDGVAKAWFWIDRHDPPPGLTVPYGLDYLKSHQPPPGDWYEIPYRCLLAAGVEGLLVAGRCVSCDREALGSLRIMPTCMYLGAAAGTGAAWAAAEGVLPSGIDGQRLKREMTG